LKLDVVQALTFLFVFNAGIDGNDESADSAEVVAIGNGSSGDTFVFDLRSMTGARTWRQDFGDFFRRL
jgi:hypothetical protein